MLVPRRLAPRTLFAALASIQVALAAPLSQEGLVFLVRSGAGASGEPVYAVADSSDGPVKAVWDRIASDPNVQRATRIYREIQDQRREAIRKELMADGNLSSQDQAVLNDLPTHPVYVEVRAGTGGAYNDWKARYTVRTASGSLQTVSAPRIVFQANDPVIGSPDRTLLPQTVVHEISHGMHAQLVGPDNTPKTPWLARPHSGNTTSDGTLALIEGYAEFAAAYITGRRTIAGDPADAIPRNLYAYDADGRAKDAESLWATEGWAATVLHEIATSGRIQGGFDKINTVIREENPSSFKTVIEEYQQAYPADAPALKSIVANMSFGKIYPESYQPSGGGGGGGTTRPPVWDEDEGGGGGRFSAGKILASVAGGFLGAMFGVSFGPVGIILAGAVGAGLGYLLGKALFDRSEGDGPESPFARILAPLKGLAGTARPAAPDLSGALARTPVEARRFLDEAYRRYRDALADGGIDLERLHAVRREYESAVASYRAAFGAAGLPADPAGPPHAPRSGCCSAHQPGQR